jgi:hypothetical protein
MVIGADARARMRMNPSAPRAPQRHAPTWLAQGERKRGDPIGSNAPIVADKARAFERLLDIALEQRRIRLVHVRHLVEIVAQLGGHLGRGEPRDAVVRIVAEAAAQADDPHRRGERLLRELGRNREPIRQPLARRGIAAPSDSMSRPAVSKITSASACASDRRRRSISSPIWPGGSRSHSPLGAG